jgi:hypothetical protein
MADSLCTSRCTSRCLHTDCAGPPPIWIHRRNRLSNWCGLAKACPRPGDVWLCARWEQICLFGTKPKGSTFVLLSEDRDARILFFLMMLERTRLLRSRLGPYDWRVITTRGLCHACYMARIQIHSGAMSYFANFILDMYVYVNWLLFLFFFLFLFLFQRCFFSCFFFIFILYIY